MFLINRIITNNILDTHTHTKDKRQCWQCCSHSNI